MPDEEIAKVAMRKETRHRNVRRVDHNYFHGWAVTVKRRGRPRVEYVRDGAHGGRERSLREALARRDAIESQLPPPVKVKSRFVLNKTGVIGVTLSLQSTRAGRRVRYYSASWSELDGRRRKRTFSVLKYGERGARQRAVNVRRDALARILGQLGARPWWQR